MKSLFLIGLSFVLIGCDSSELNQVGVSNMSSIDLKASVSPSLNSFQDAEYSSQKGLGINIPAAIYFNAGQSEKTIVAVLSFDQIQCTYSNRSINTGIVVEDRSVKTISGESIQINWESCSDGSTVGSQRTIYDLKLHIDEGSTNSDAQMEAKIQSI
jgi:hypothetical protein